MSRRESKGPELMPEGLKSSLEVRRRDATESISDGDTNLGLETTKKLALAREEAPAMDEEQANSGRSSREEEQALEKSHEAGHDMGQMQYRTLANRSDENHAHRNSPETIQVLAMPPIIPGKMKGDDLVGQNVKVSVVREDRCMITIPKITMTVDESADADKE
jgi:hypothetical protein